MEKLKYIDNFCLNVERQRVALGYSQEKFAEKIGMSLASYKRLINGEVIKMDLYNVYKLYLLTGMLLCELVDYTGDVRIDVIKELRSLTPSELDLVMRFIKYLKTNGNNYIMDFCKAFIDK